MNAGNINFIWWFYIDINIVVAFDIPALAINHVYYLTGRELCDLATSLGLWRLLDNNCISLVVSLIKAN